MEEGGGRSHAASAREPMLRAAGDVEQQGEVRSGALSGGSPERARPQPRPVSLWMLFKYATNFECLVLVLATLGAIVQGISGPALSFFMKDLFQAIYFPNDNGSLPPHATGPHTERDDKVRHNLILFLCLAVISFTASYMSFAGFSYVGDRLSMELKRRFFDHLLRKDVGWYDQHGTGEMATRLTNDTYDFRQGVSDKLASVVMGLAMSPAGFAVAFTHDWRLTLMMFIGIPFLAGSFAVAFRILAKASAAQQENYAKAGGIAETSLGAIRTVAAFGGYEREVAKYEEQLAAAERNGVRAGLCNGLSMGFSNLAIQSTFSLGFYVGSILVVKDYDNDCWKSSPPFGTCFTGSTMLATLFAVLYGGIGLGQTAPGFAAITAAKAAAARIYEVIDEPAAFDADAGERLSRVQGLVEFREVTFSYPSRPDFVALKGMSFVAPAGNTVAFVGPSGSGKSTIISLLQRFYDPSGGAVLIDGHKIQGLSLTWLRTQMALVQQEPVLFSGSIYDNIAYGVAGPATRTAVETAARAANAHNFIMEFPGQYKTEVGERGTQLSGGQKQRIAIARAVIRDPAILLLDEATSALDTESERIVQKALDDLMKQRARTTFVVAHRLSTIRDAHKIVVMEDGKLVEEGTHAELMGKAGGLYAQLVELQELGGVEGTPGGAGRVLARSNTSGSAGGGAGVSPANLARALSDGVSPANCARGVSGGSQNARGGETPMVADGDEGAAVTESAPAEDCQDAGVSTLRLWALQRPYLRSIVVALLCTIPVAVGRPLMGYLFSNTSNLLNKPAAIRLPDGTWHGVLDTDALRESANQQCLQFFLLGCTLFVAMAGQLGGFRRGAEGLTRRIRSLTFRAMLRQEIAWYDARSTGELANRLATDAPLIKSFTGESLALVLQTSLTLCTGLGVACWASWKLTLCNVVFVPLLFFGSLTLMRAMKKINETAAGPMVTEVMGHVRTVAAFGLRERMLERYMALLRSEHAAERKKSRSTAFAAAYNSGVTFIMFGGVVFVANIFINQGWTEPGDVLQVLFPVMFAASGMAIAAQWSADKAKARMAVNHIFTTLDRQPQIDAYSTSGRVLDKVAGSIEFSHVSFRYPTRPAIAVFEDFDLKIEPNTTVAVCGPSGSGKSTTIALLQRFYDPQGGVVRLDGNDIRELNLSWLRRQMSLVQQEPVLFAGSVMQNIAYGREGATDAECMEAARLANAHDFVTGFPDGYNTDVGERGAQLSGGQKQRIAIARSIVRDPAVLLLDEATSALDTESEKVVQEALDSLLANMHRTTLVIAHRLSTIANADVICVVYQGKIVEKGKHSVLMKIEGGHYRQLAERQQAVRAT